MKRMTPEAKAKAAATRKANKANKASKETPDKVNIGVRRITKEGGFHLEGYGKLEEGTVVTQEIRKLWDAFQKKCQSNININNYTS